MIVSLNHRLLPRDQARIDPFDRGFLFADGVYEGLRAFSGHVVGMPLHVRRLAAGLRELRIDFDAGLMVERTRELLDANRLRDAFIYWQVTRGVPAPGHSDFAVCRVSPWTALAAMVTRRTQSGVDLDAREAITPHEAVRAYTWLGAWAQREEQEKGSLEVASSPT